MVFWKTPFDRMFGHKRAIVGRYLLRYVGQTGGHGDVDLLQRSGLLVSRWRC